MIKSVALLLLFLASAACEGPAGPAGPQGPSGPGTRQVFTGRLNSSGDATVSLPAAAGTMSNPPAVTCFLGQVQAGPYLVIAADTYAGVACGIGTSGSSLAVSIIDGPSLWYYIVTVVY